MRLSRLFGAFSLDEADGFKHFDPMQSLRALAGSLARKANFLGASLSLLHGEGFGQGYFARVNLSMLLFALKNLESRGIANPTLFEIGAELGRMARSRQWSKDAEALYALEQLLCYAQFAAFADSKRNIDIDRAIDFCELVYFFLPSLLEPLSARATALLFIWSILIEAAKRKKQGKPQRTIIIAIDECSLIVGGKSFEDAIVLCRRLGVILLLCHQTSTQLRYKHADLRPVVTDNTSIRVYFTLPTKEDADEIINHSKLVNKPRKSTTARSFDSSVTMQENEVPGFDSNLCKDISGTFGHAVLIRELGDVHREPEHLICIPPVSKEIYDELGNRSISLPESTSPLSGAPQFLVSVSTPEEIELRRSALRNLVSQCRERLHGWRDKMPKRPDSE